MSVFLPSTWTVLDPSIPQRPNWQPFRRLHWHSLARLFMWQSALRSSLPKLFYAALVVLTILDGSRMITAIISSSTRDGPASRLRIPVVRPRSDPIFSLVMRGDIEGIQSEFCKSSASPFDVHEAGYGLVWVSGDHSQNIYRAGDWLYPLLKSALSAFNPRMLETCHFLLCEKANLLDEESRYPKRWVLCRDWLTSLWA